MPIQQDPSILTAVKQRTGARDEITRILNKETKPRQQDITNSTFENVRLSLGQRDKARSVDEVFRGRVNEQIAPQMDIYNLADQAVKSGSEQAKSMMETFGKFADTPENLAALWAAAEEDPEEVTVQNAATFAARKSRELGFQSAKTMQAENQRMFGEARLAAVGNKAAKDSTDKSDAFTSMYGGGQAQPSMDSFPTDASLVPSSGTMLLPPVAKEGVAPQMDMGQVQPIQPTVQQPAQQSGVLEVNGVQINPTLFQAPIREMKILTPEKFLTRVDSIRKGKPFLQAQMQGDEANKVLAEVGYSRSALNELAKQGLSTGILQNFVGGLLNQPQFEVLKKSGSATAILQRVAGTGAVSNFDAQELKNQVMDPSKNPGSIRVVLGAMEAEAKNQKDFADYMDWYVGSFGTETGAKQVWDQFRKANPMVEFDFKAMMPKYLPGFNADWRQYVSGMQQAPAGQVDLMDKYGLKKKSN